MLLAAILLQGACSMQTDPDPDLARRAGTYTSATAVRVAHATLTADGDTLRFTISSSRTMGGTQPAIEGALTVDGEQATATDATGCSRTLRWDDPDTLIITESGCDRLTSVAGRYRRGV